MQFKRPMYALGQNSSLAAGSLFTQLLLAGTSASGRELATPLLQPDTCGIRHQANSIRLKYDCVCTTRMAAMAW
jgi:hypothetical protein